MQKFHTVIELSRFQGPTMLPNFGWLLPWRYPALAEI